MSVGIEGRLSKTVRWSRSGTGSGRDRRAEFDRQESWKPAARRSCAHWLAVRIGYDLNTCRQHRPGGPSPDAPVSGSRVDRYMALLHVDRNTLREDPQGPGRSELGATGTTVSADTARRLCCDAGLVPVIRGAEGEVLDVGRKRRTVPPALRRALEAGFASVDP